MEENIITITVKGPRTAKPLSIAAVLKILLERELGRTAIELSDCSGQPAEQLLIDKCVEDMEDRLEVEQEIEGFLRDNKIVLKIESHDDAPAGPPVKYVERFGWLLLQDQDQPFHITLASVDQYGESLALKTPEAIAVTEPMIGTVMGEFSGKEMTDAFLIELTKRLHEYILENHPKHYNGYIAAQKVRYVFGRPEAITSRLIEICPEE